MIDPNAPAYPLHPELRDWQVTGMTIRAEIASRMMAGLVSCAEMRSRYSQEDIAQDAVSLADALIAELNKE